MGNSMEQADHAWQELFGGEIRTLPTPEPGPEVVAVLHKDFRPDPGNWPKILHHRRRTDRVLVLIHGLKDSPGYLETIGRRFAARGINVLLPLLPGHGRREPTLEMARVDRSDWRSVVDRSVEIAATLGSELSIGGLSTGGALALDHCLRHPTSVAGKVFLFAAALGLPAKARLILSSRLATRLCDLLAERKASHGTGGNPLKYSRQYFHAGRQVHLLIQDIRSQAGADFEQLEAFEGRIFVAHSEADATIPVDAVKHLVEPSDPGQHHLVAEALDVARADLVMAEPMIYDKLTPDEPDPPRANPEFEPMIEKALAFLER